MLAMDPPARAGQWSLLLSHKHPALKSFLRREVVPISIRPVPVVEETHRRGTQKILLEQFRPLFSIPKGFLHLLGHQGSCPQFST